MAKKKRNKNPVAKNMYTGETGFKQQTQVHQGKKKYKRVKKVSIEKDQLP